MAREDAQKDFLDSLARLQEEEEHERLAIEWERQDSVEVCLVEQIRLEEEHRRWLDAHQEVYHNPLETILLVGVLLAAINLSCMLVGLRETCVAILLATLYLVILTIKSYYDGTRRPPTGTLNERHAVGVGSEGPQNRPPLFFPRPHTLPNYVTRPTINTTIAARRRKKQKKRKHEKAYIKKKLFLLLFLVSLLVLLLLTKKKVISLQTKKSTIEYLFLFCIIFTIVIIIIVQNVTSGSTRCDGVPLCYDLLLLSLLVYLDIHSFSPFLFSVCSFPVPSTM
ncbi:hypothetical protein AGDE_15610 [Angomonas deanei]|nr:hypothetical protein AGDE_15610 [Angomonas deanei]|eukprot:EPY18768.1 hypothetical protein AGDE_15610 [Angomonas deanei]